jgi:hypothetical protein
MSVFNHLPIFAPISPLFFIVLIVFRVTEILVCVCVYVELYAGRWLPIYKSILTTANVMIFH